MARILVAALAVIALLASGCAKATGSGAPPAAPINADMSQNGTRVEMVPGQRLVVHLGKPFRLAKGQKPLVQYPAGLMSFSPDEAVVGEYVFQAHRSGSGQIQILAAACRPGPALGAGNRAPGCPVVGSQPWRFSLAVRITGRE